MVTKLDTRKVTVASQRVSLACLPGQRFELFIRLYPHSAPEIKGYVHFAGRGLGFVSNLVTSPSFRRTVDRRNADRAKLILGR